MSLVTAAVFAHMVCAGCTALVIGNSVKAGMCFMSYNWFKQALADKDVSIVSLNFCLSSQVVVSRGKWQG